MNGSAGFLWHGSPSGFLYTVLLAVMLKVRHPAPEDMEPLGPARIVVAIVTLIVFRALVRSFSDHAYLSNRDYEWFIAGLRSCCAAAVP